MAIWRRRSGRLPRAAVGKRPGSVLLKSLCELERFLACLDGVLGDDHLCIEAAEFEVSFGDALDQGGAGRSLTPLAGQKISPCGFALTAIEAPEIEVPCSGRAGTSAVKEGVRECAVVPGASERRRDLKRAVTRTTADRRQLLRADDANLRLGLEHTLRRDVEIEIVGEGILDQALQRGILKDHRPLLVGDGGRLRGRRDVGSKCLAIAARHVDRGPLVVRPYLATNQ